MSNWGHGLILPLSVVHFALTHSSTRVSLSTRRLESPSTYRLPETSAYERIPQTAGTYESHDHFSQNIFRNKLRIPGKERRITDMEKNEKITNKKNKNLLIPVTQSRNRKTEFRTLRHSRTQRHICFFPCVLALRYRARN